MAIIRRIRFAWWWVWRWWFWIWIYWYVRFPFSLWRIHWLCWWLCWSCSWCGVWHFFSDRNRVNRWCCLVGCVCTKRSRVQRQSNHRNILAPKVLIVPPSFKISFVAIVLLWPHPAHSNRCNLSKNMTRHIPMGIGPIRGPYYSCIRGTNGVDFILCADIWDTQMHKIWCLGSNGITCEVHLTAKMDVGADTFGQFATHHFSENGCRIPVIG